MEYKNGKVCPECHVPEGWVHTQTKVEGYGWKHDFDYSCAHFKERSQSSPCKYCGKKNSPVRQVPAPCPVSDCYCDDCRDKCRDEYMAVVKRVADAAP